MKYTIVIPTYNHCDDLLKPCIDSIFKYTNIYDIELIVSANGCKDNTFSYLQTLKKKYQLLQLENNFKIVWNDQPLGYSKACNVAITEATTDLIVLLNNDTVLLPQNKNDWLSLLENPFNANKNCGISCVIKGPSEPAGRDFAIFFCVMIHRKVFDKIGLLSLDYGVGGGEDTEFSIECENAGFEVLECMKNQWDSTNQIFSGNFPIYHKGEGTLHDKNLVPEWDDIFLTNSLTLAKKYNPKWYQWRLSNYWERAVFFKGDPVAPREITRYSWAAQNIFGTKVFELGCSSGYGLQFLPEHIEYTGLDYDKRIIPVAIEQQWRPNAKFVHGDINNYELGQYDTIIAFEVIEHLENGLEIVEKLKKHCKRLMITVPMLETPNLWGPHHKLHNLDESYFPGFKFKFIAPDGSLRDEPHNRGDRENINLMLCVWDNDNSDKTRTYKQDLQFLNQQHSYIFNEVIERNIYEVDISNIKDYEFIDVGSNIGCFASFVGYLNAKKVIAVEPVQTTYQQMVSNVNRLTLYNVMPLQRAVGTTDDIPIRLFKGSDSGLNSIYSNTENYDIVNTITLKTLLSMLESDSVFLKCDCEGAEYDLLMDASNDDMKRIKTIAIEIHEDLHPKYKGSEVLHEKFIKWGFHRTQEKRIYTWDLDSYGNRINMKPLPVVVEIWKK
jgi:FkbM family methyltransferase